ncbi:histidine N-acetyltransferase-like [Narcine bancroftii]|uniref:histidine N-acetyltransferase-like n=1 Tax=Narcine bancroftii TaxID=1343680 RepID=UPI003831BDEF
MSVPLHHHHLSARMEGASHGLEFCLAQESDYEQVLAISTDIYGGLDYLPSRYHSWLVDKQRQVLLAKKQDRLVALVSVRLIDDGCTVLVEGLRVAPEDRGQGIARRIQQHALDLMKSRFPVLEMYRSVRVGPLSPEVLAKYRLVCQQAVLLLRFHPEDLWPRLEAAIVRVKDCAGEWEEPVQLEADEMKRLFLDPRVVEAVLPNGIIIHDWVPYRPLLGNLEALLQLGVTAMADHRTEPTTLSLSSPPYAIPAGNGHQRLNVDLFGKNYRQARDQLLAHLRALPLYPDPIHCLVYLHPSLWDPIRSFCGQQLALRDGRHIDGQKVLEAEL